MASLRLDNLSKRFQDVPALSEVNLHVEDGEFCVLLGPSGCGKSTLLKIVAGLERQDHGVVFLDDECIDAFPPRLRDVAMVFQDYALYPHMTVSENLGFGLRMRGMSKSDISDHVLQAARMLGIEHLLGRKPRQLSGGQRQRVAMGRALVRRPRLFLLDEPLSNLDAKLRASVRLELKRLHQQIGTTIIYVTHDQVEAMTLGDKVVVMREGRVHQVGRPEAIYDCPSDTFVATFVGSPTMNLFQGRLVREAKGLEFHCQGFSLDLGNRADFLAGDSVEVGVRPEDISLSENGGTRLQAQVEMLSYVGAEKYIHGRLGETLITVRASKEATYTAGEMICLFVDPHALHIFHKGRRI
jgi:multiple sugar transport system ATP-binding protein